MRAIFLTELGRLEMRDIPAPVITRPTDVLIRIGLAGVCGSDIHYFQDGRIGDASVRYPFLVGHECAGTVMQIGSAVRQVQPGDRVAIDPAMVCHQCDQCRAGRPHTCRSLSFLGCPGEANGCYSDFVVMPEENLFLLPESVSLELGVLCEPFSIACYALQQAGLSGPHRGPASPSLTSQTDPLDIGILGLGPIGTSLLLVAQARLGGRIMATDRIDDRITRGHRHGADWTGNADQPETVPEILQRCPNGLDIVFECAGQQAALDQALRLLKPGGKLVIVGIPRENTIHFNINLLRRKEIMVINVRRQNGCMPAAVEFVSTFPHRSVLEALVTHHFLPEQAQAAFEMTSSYQDSVMKSVLKFCE